MILFIYLREQEGERTRAGQGGGGRGRGTSRLTAHWVRSHCGVSRGSKMPGSGGQPAMPPLLQTAAVGGCWVLRCSWQGRSSQPGPRPALSLLVSQCQLPGSLCPLGAPQSIITVLSHHSAWKLLSPKNWLFLFGVVLLLEEVKVTSVTFNSFEIVHLFSEKCGVPTERVYFSIGFDTTHLVFGVYSYSRSSKSKNISSCNFLIKVQWFCGFSCRS